MALASLSSFIHEMNPSQRYSIRLGEYFTQNGITLDNINKYDKYECDSTKKWIKFFALRDVTLTDVLSFEDGWLDHGDWVKQGESLRAGEHCLFEKDGKFFPYTYFYLTPEN